MTNTPVMAIPLVVRQRRWWLGLLLVWSGVVGVAFYVHTLNMRDQSITVALEGARNMFRMVVLTRSWNASHVGVYVPITPQTQPNPYLDDPLRDVVTTGGLALTKINPAYMTRLIASMANAESGAVFRLTSLRPIRPANAPDDWERVALTQFEQGQSEVVSVQTGQFGKQLRYMAPLPVIESCLACHAKQGYQVGQVRGGISVSLPFAPIEQATQSHVRDDALIYLAVFALVAVAGWLLLEVLRRRWLELVSNAMALSESQRKLLQAEKLASVGQLAAGLAHEINNPVGFVTSNLGSLKTYSDNLLRLLALARSGRATPADFAGADLDFIQEDMADLLRESHEGLARVKTLVTQLKGFSQVDKEAWQWVDINALVEDTLGVLWGRIKDKAELVRELGSVPPVACMPSQINQVLMALLLNAAHALTGPGRITVRSGVGSQQAWFEVADTGCGMAPEVQQRMFEPFFTTRAVGQGTGLGLSVAHDVVQAHGGRIEVQSAPGQGSTVRVWLPLQANAHQVPGPNPAD